MTKTKVLTECAILIALSSVLSLIKFWEYPWGGSITLLSMLPVAVISIRHGIKDGLFSAFVYSVIQLVFGITMSGLLGWGLTSGMLIMCILLDYIIAFTVIGFAGIFNKKGIMGAVFGTALVCLLRYISHFLSGVYVFASAGKLWETFNTDNSYIYSAVYNACYMLPEMILTVIGAILIYKYILKPKR